MELDSSFLVETEQILVSFDPEWNQNSKDMIQVQENQSLQEIEESESSPFYQKLAEKACSINDYRQTQCDFKQRKVRI